MFDSVSFEIRRNMNQINWISVGEAFVLEAVERME